MAALKKDPNDPNYRNSRVGKIVGLVVAVIIAIFLIYFFLMPRSHTTTEPVVAPAQTVPQTQPAVPVQSVTPAPTDSNTNGTAVPDNSTAPATTNQ